MLIRTAQLKDIRGIYNLILTYSSEKLLLPRGKNDIEKNIDKFFVATECDSVIGCGAYDDYPPELYEIRSLAVKTDFLMKGIGSQIVRKIEVFLQANKVCGTHCKVFALTYKPDFFLKSGYMIGRKENLPWKIWQVCFFCEKFDSCDEIVVTKELTK